MKPILSLLWLVAGAFAVNGANGNISPVGITVPTLNTTAADAEPAEDTRQWVDVTLETPGSLGVEILYKVDVLADVKHLRINGSMNSDDWATIKNIAGLQSLDLSNAITASIPDQQFQNRTALSDITLPASLTSIGEYAFSKTSLPEITIPAAVKTISPNCFRETTSLTGITFEEGSALTSIGDAAFYRCYSLKAIVIPDGVRVINQNCFYECKVLSDVKLPKSLTSIDSNAFAYTSALSLIDFPETLTSIGSRAFSYSGLTAVILPKKLSALDSYCFDSCKQMTDLVLPAAINSYSNYQFYSCSGLKNVTCLSATPPSISNYGISGLNKAGATLHVPEYAKVNYKLDSFWLGFGNIVGDATSDYWQIAKDLALTNNRRMEGTPDIDITSRGCLTVGGNAAMPINNLKLFVDMYDYWAPNFYSSQIISNCPAITAEKVSSRYRFARNVWYFISFAYDVNVADIRSLTYGADFAVRYYDGAQRAASGTGASWKNVPADGVLEAGKGYIFMSSAEAYFNFPASEEGKAKLFDPNARVMALESNPSDKAANAGWNYVGNPYQSYYDMYYTMLTCPVTVWNMSDNKYVAYSLIDDNLVLRPGQAFFIQSSETLSEIEFGTLGRQFNKAVSHPASVAAIKADRTRCLFDIDLAFNGRTDRTRVVLNEDASLSYESSCDAAKFFSDSPEVPQLYTVDADGNMLAINERPEADGLVTLGFYAPEAGSMTIEASRTAGKATLHDALTGNVTVLEVGVPYTFEVAGAGHDTARFSINFDGSGTTTGVGSIRAGNAVISVEGNVLTVSGAESLEVFTADGRAVVSESLAGEARSFTLAAGLYIVKAGDTTQKCIIK